MWRVVLIGCVCLLGACPSDPTCTRNSECPAGSYCSGGACATECTPETVDDDCGEGASCSSFGMCVLPADAGPPPDASRSDGGTDAPDVRAACVVAGGVDTDGDGYCVTGTDADCDDSDSSTNPGELEICTARTASLENRAIDENCDGEIDEDCPWHFGTLHSVVPVHSGSSIHEGGQLSSDGLRLYVRGYDASGRFALTLSARPSLTTPFAAPSVVATADLIGRPIGDAALSADELELFVDDDRGAPQSDIYRATRLTRDAAFGPLVAVTELNSPTDRDYALTLSRDGLEVFYARQGTDGARRLLRATRPSPTTPFGAAEPVTIPGSTLGDAGIAFSEDGLTAFVQRLGASGSRVFRLERASRETAVFDSAVEVIEVGDSGVSYTSLAWVDERHREASSSRRGPGLRPRLGSSAPRSAETVRAPTRPSPALMAREARTSSIATPWLRRHRLGATRRPPASRSTVTSRRFTVPPSITSSGAPLERLISGDGSGSRRTRRPGCGAGTEAPLRPTSTGMLVNRSRRATNPSLPWRRRRACGRTGRALPCIGESASANCGPHGESIHTMDDSPGRRARGLPVGPHVHPQQRLCGRAVLLGRRLHHRVHRRDGRGRVWSGLQLQLVRDVHRTSGRSRRRHGPS